MELSTLLKRAEYVRYESLINGTQAADIDKWVNLINKSQDCFKADTKAMNEKPVSQAIANVNKKLRNYSREKLKEYARNLWETITKIIDDRPYLKEQVLAIK